MNSEQRFRLVSLKVTHHTPVVSVGNPVCRRIQLGRWPSNPQRNSCLRYGLRDTIETGTGDCGFVAGGCASTSRGYSGGSMHLMRTYKSSCVN
eukprot:COSAG02_NODE_1805_length_10872_cov_7.969461_3_plen_93_part_00